jgi:hypothetical protein
VHARALQDRLHVAREVDGRRLRPGILQEEERSRSVRERAAKAACGVSWRERARLHGKADRSGAARRA